MKTQINNFPHEVLILAGGRGTRLSGLISDLPKPMAPINGKPFLYHLMADLRNKGIEHFVLSVGYKHEIIKDYFGDEFMEAKISYAIEKEPLGTGGAIKHASHFCTENTFWVINGDTFVDINLESFYHDCTNMDLSIALLEMNYIDRFGTVKTDGNYIIKFEEKKYVKRGLINAGLYLLSKSFIAKHFPQVSCFSFEKDIMEKIVKDINIGYYKSTSAFIDIGIPDDYFKAQKLFTNKSQISDIFNFGNEWTIFLDRDGVINERIVGGYVSETDQFIFTKGAIKSIVKLSKSFGRIIVVTNQQAIGLGKITRKKVDNINDYMLRCIENEGGKIDGIYVCGMKKSEVNNCRKPNTELAQQAKMDFPEIDFNKSIMIGDSISDIEFGNNLSMKTILITSKEEEKLENCNVIVDWRMDGLEELI